MEDRLVSRVSCRDDELEDTLEKILNHIHGHVLAVSRIGLQSDLDGSTQEPDSWEVVFWSVKDE